MLSAKDFKTPYACSLRGTARGFTLIELMIIVALLGIFAAIAVPSFTQFISNNRTQSANNELLSLLQFARSTAVSQRTTISVCPSDDIWLVKEKNCTAAAITLRSMEVASGTSISSSQNQIIFRHNGTPAASATIQTCKNGDFSNGFTATVASAGSIRTFPRGMTSATENMTNCGTSG